MNMKNIAVVFGGYSSEHGVSVKSGEFIYENLKDNPDWNIYEICISKKEKTVKFDERIFDLDFQNFTFEIDGIIIKPDAVFNIIHGDPGENGVLAEVLEKNHIPQTGCNNYVSQLTFNKDWGLGSSSTLISNLSQFAKIDPYELNNLAKDQSQNELLLKMNTKLNALMDKEVGLENHVIHLPGPDWFWTT